MANNKRVHGWIKGIAITCLISLVTVGMIIWYIFSEKFTNTSERKADYTIDAVNLISRFEENNSSANKKYSEKIITVNGIISEPELADTVVNLKMTKSTTGSYLIFAFQKDYFKVLRKLREGDRVSIKGSCSGGAFSEILGAEFVTFKRCVINK